MPSNARASLASLLSGQPIGRRPCCISEVRVRSRTSLAETPPGARQQGRVRRGGTIRRSSPARPLPPARPPGVRADHTTPGREQLSTSSMRCSEPPAGGGQLGRHGRCRVKPRNLRVGVGRPHGASNDARRAGGAEDRAAGQIGALRELLNGSTSVSSGPNLWVRANGGVYPANGPRPRRAGQGPSAPWRLRRARGRTERPHEGRSGLARGSALVTTIRPFGARQPSLRGRLGGAKAPKCHERRRAEGPIALVVGTGSWRLNRAGSESAEGRVLRGRNGVRVPTGSNWTRH